MSQNAATSKTHTSRNPKAQRILIAGCGDVGGRAGLRLLERGHRVWGLRRNPDRLPEGLEPVAADLTDPATLADLAEQLGGPVDAVAYTAAADGFSQEAYRRAYVEGLENLLEVLEAWDRPPRRLLFTSSTGVYHQSDGSRVDEGSPTEPQRFSGRRVLEGEERCRASPIPSVSLRLGGIYGPGRTRLLDRVADGEAVCPEGEPVYTNRIHSQDAAGALAHLLELETPEEIYLGVDDEPAERCEVLRYLAGLLGVDPPRVVPPEEADRRRGGSKRCSNRRLRESGYEFLYPTYREGYRELVEGGPRPPE